MFTNWFKRPKATLATSQPMIPEPNAVAPKKSPLEAFEEEWDAAHEVIEGNGGDTDWGAWTEAVENREKSFAPTAPMPLEPDLAQISGPKKNQQG